VTGAILLQPAISPGYDLSTALAHSERGIWNFRSILDVILDGIGTSLAGTSDGRHFPAAGMLGFRPPRDLGPAGKELYDTRLFEVSFHPAMILDFHFGGHFGPTNRVFVAERIAPLLTGTAP
jgi:hypothetical protein